MERDNRMPEFSSVPNARLFATLCEMFFFGRSEKRHSYCSDLTNSGKKNRITRENKVLWPREDFAQTPRFNVLSQLSVEEKQGRRRMLAVEE